MQDNDNDRSPSPELAAAAYVSNVITVAVLWLLAAYALPWWWYVMLGDGDLHD